MRIGLVMASIGLLLTGCASSGPLGKDVLVAPLAPQKSRLVIYRTSPLGFAVQPDYVIDGKAVGASQPEGFVVCQLNPGKHDVSVGNFELNVNLGGGSDKASLALRPGQTAYLKAEPQLGLTLGVITLSEVTESQGQADTASLHKIEAACA
jgi:hypothetical protein